MRKIVQERKGILNHLLLPENDSETQKRKGKNKYMENFKKQPSINLKENQKIRESARNEECSDVNKVLRESQGTNCLPLNYNYGTERMMQLFSRPLFIKYLKKEKPHRNRRAEAFIGLDGNYEAVEEDDFSAILSVEEDLVDAQQEPEVALDMLELPDQFGLPDIGQD